MDALAKNHEEDIYQYMFLDDHGATKPHLGTGAVDNIQDTAADYQAVRQGLPVGAGVDVFAHVEDQRLVLQPLLTAPGGWLEWMPKHADWASLTIT